MGLTLKTFGDFSVRDEFGTEVSLRTRKTRGLLAYLVVNADKPQPRERLMGLLWSDRSERQARQSLNDALKSIRRLSNNGGPALLDSDGEQVTLHGEALESDVERFHALAIEDPTSAAALYVGPFLDGLAIPDPTFEEWVRKTRAVLQDRACEVLEKAADSAIALGDLKAAINFTKRLLSLDPVCEEAHRHLIQLFHQSGDRAGALRQYQSCADILRRELQIEPDARTLALFVEIRRESGPVELGREAPDRPPALPDKPSIAVLPFIKLGDNPEEELFADGMAEDIITGLSRIRWLLVIARSSTFAYKGKSPDVRQVGKDLGVRYVLEGSIRKHVDQLRVTAQLVDATAGTHVWADSYDRKLVDIFEIQDEITDAIVGTLIPQIDRTERLRATERIRAKRMAPESLDAWTQYQQALSAYHVGTLESLTEAITFFDKAADLDPSFAVAYAMGGACRNRLVINHGINDNEAILEEAGRRLSTAVALDPQDATCRCIYGVWLTLNEQYDLALDSLAKAVELSPSSAEAHHFNAMVLLRSGRVEEAMASVDRAIRLSPNDPRIAAFYLVRSACLFELAKYDECAVWARRSIHSPNPRSLAFVRLAAALYYLDRKDEARTVLGELRSKFPEFDFASFLRSRRGGGAQSLDRYVTALRDLGFAD